MMLPKHISIKKLIFIISLLIQQVFIFSQDESQAIQDVFNQYKSAILAGQNDKAIEYMDNKTLDYFKSIHHYVLSADSLTLESLSLMDKFTVLSIRQMATKKEILAFTDKSIIVFTIKKGMMGKKTLESFSLGKINVKNKFAKALILEDGKKSDKYYHFYFDGSNWKIDITPLFPAQEKEAEELIKKTGKSENEFIMGILEIISEKKPSPAIWKKIK